MLVAYPNAQQATGADFGGGGLWIASGTTAGAGSTLLRLDSTTGVIQLTVPIPGLTARIVDLAFDPFFGGLYALCEDDPLRQIDFVTGAILATQDLGPFLIDHSVVAGGFDFDDTGAKVFVANGSGAGADSVVVLEREFSTVSCGSQLGTFACPCSNVGQIGRGCRNSSLGNAGAVLSSTCVPRTVADSFELHATGVVPGSSLLFFQGTAGIEPALAFGDGVRCVGGTVIRLAIRAVPTGTVIYPGAGDPLIHVLGLIPPAAGTRYSRAWYRDTGSFCTSSLFNRTNAIEVEWRL